MTKKNVLKIIDKLFWIALVLFPLVVYVVLCFNNNMTDTSLLDVFANLGLDFSFDSPIYTAMYQLFAVGGGYLELVTSNTLIVFATYYFTLEVLHLIIDILLILIRMAQKWLHNGEK